MSLVTCARVGDALTDWLGTASQLKKDALCEALGCGPTDAEIAEVFMNCDGVAHIPGAAIPTCDEMDAAITDAISVIFAGGTDGQVWTKRADGTQGWADVRVSEDAGNIIEVRGDGLFAEIPEPVIPECEVVPSLWEVLTAQKPGQNGLVDVEYGHFSAVVKLAEVVTPEGTLLGFFIKWDGNDGLEIQGGEIVLPALPSAPTGLVAAIMGLSVYPFASGQQVVIVSMMVAAGDTLNWGESYMAHVTNLTSGEVSFFYNHYDPNGNEFTNVPTGFFNDTDTYCLNVSLMPNIQ